MNIADSFARLGAFTLDIVESGGHYKGKLPEGRQLQYDHSAALMLIPALFLALSEASGKSVPELIAEFAGTITDED